MQFVLFEKAKDFSNSMKESLRALRTNIQFCGDDIKTILVTSAIPNEGKSSVSFNLARSLVESEKTVLLLDTDMRKSVFMERTGARCVDGQIYGLSHYLSGQKTLSDVFCSTDMSGLYTIFSGPRTPNPTEMLDNRRFKSLLEYAKTKFDYIIIDCAPLGTAIDAAVVAKHCDGAILVVGQGMASSRMVVSAKKQLEQSGVRVLGAVLNKVKKTSHSYGYGYGYDYY